MEAIQGLVLRIAPNIRIVPQPVIPNVTLNPEEVTRWHRRRAWLVSASKIFPTFCYYQSSPLSEESAQSEEDGFRSICA